MTRCHIATVRRVNLYCQVATCNIAWTYVPTCQAATFFSVGELMRLATRGDLAEMLAISRQRTRTLTEREDFPDPVAILRTGPVWRLEDLQVWAVKVGRTLAPLPGYSDGKG